MINHIIKSVKPAAWSQWPFYADDEIDAVIKVLRSGKVNYWTGNEGQLFEKEFANAVGTKFAVALMNGTVALEAALYVLDIREGDEVITSSRTFIASASCAVWHGAKPVLADVDIDSQNITAETIEKVITPKTKAIIAVHLAGWPCDMEPILALAKKYNLYVIEDCAQATGAKYKGRPVGSWGDIGAFSFCQDKIISTGGEGGMITTSNESIWEKIWALKDHGKSFSAVHHKNHAPGFRWLHESFGTNWRMTEMQAAIGRVQLKKLSNWLAIRRRNAAILSHYLRRFPIFRMPLPHVDFLHSYYKYYIFVQRERLKSGWSRDRLLKTLMSYNIPCFTGSCSELYLEKAFIKAGWGHSERLPIAKLLGESSLMFLVHPTLTEKKMHEMAEVIGEVARLALP